MSGVVRTRMFRVLTCLVASMSVVTLALDALEALAAGSYRNQLLIAGWRETQPGARAVNPAQPQAGHSFTEPASLTVAAPSFPIASQLCADARFAGVGR